MATTVIMIIFDLELGYCDDEADVEGLLKITL